MPATPPTVWVHTDAQETALNGIGIATQRYEILYGQDIFDVTDPDYQTGGAYAGDGRSFIAHDTSASGPFLTYRANPNSSYWTKINAAIAHGGPIMVDIEPVYPPNFGAIEDIIAAYNTACEHVLTQVKLDAPSNRVTLYACPLKQEYKFDGAVLYNETNRQTALASYATGAYTHIDFYTMQTYQSYYLSRGYRATYWAKRELDASKLLGETWAQVWGYTVDADDYTFTGTNLITSDDMDADIASPGNWDGVSSAVVTDLGSGTGAGTTMRGYKLQSGSSSSYLQFRGITTTAQQYTAWFWIKAGSGTGGVTTANVSIYDTAHRVQSCDVIEGPGVGSVVSNTGRITGLATNDWTLVKIVTPVLAGNSNTLLVYYPEGTSGQTTGNHVTISHARMVAGTSASDGWSVGLYQSCNSNEARAIGRAIKQAEIANVMLFSRVSDPLTGTDLENIRLMVSPDIAALPSSVDLSGTSEAYVKPLPLTANLTIDKNISDRSYTTHNLTVTQDNLTIQNIRSRPGRESVDDGTKSADAVDGITIDSRSNCTITNCSFAWATDENININKSDGITIDSCISSEGLNNTNHPSSVDDNHGCGLLVVGKPEIGTWSTPVTISNNLFASNSIRNPQILARGASEPGVDGEVRVIVKNNVTYNPGEEVVRFDASYWADEVGDSSSSSSVPTFNCIVDYVGNIVIPGPDTTSTDLDKIALKIQQANYSQVYFADNYIWIDGEWQDLSAWAAARRGEPELLWKLTSNFSPVYETNPNTVYTSVLQNAGAMPRDQHDQRIVDEIIAATNRQPNYPPIPFGYETDANLDAASNLIHHWTFDSNGSDSVGAGNITLAGSETFSGSPIGNAITVQTGTELSAGNLSDTNFGAGDDFTVSFWVYMHGAPGADVDIILKKGSRSNSAFPGWAFYVGGSGDDNMFFRVADTSGRDLYLNSGAASVPYGEWIHFAGTLNRTTNTMTLYKNGVGVDDIEDSGTGNTISQLGDLTNAVSLVMGDTLNASNISFDDVRIYNRCLSANDIYSLYAPKVTTLEDNPRAGSLRYALSIGGNLDFDVVGDFVLKRPIQITKPNTTIDGTGLNSIRIWGHQLSVESGANNFVIKQVSLLPGDFNAMSGNGKATRGLGNADATAVNGIEFKNVKNAYMENCSVYWSMDEGIDILDSDVTINRSLIAMPLHDSNHPSGNHSLSCLIQQTTKSNIIRLYNNLFTHSLARNPGISVNDTGKLTISLVGNIFYNTSTHAFHTISGGTNAVIDAVSNRWMYGADTAWGIYAWFGIKDIPVYKTGNLIEYGDNSTIDPWLETSGSWVASADLANQSIATKSHVVDNISPLSKDGLLAVVGASTNRWQLDTDIISDVQNKTGYLQNSTDEFSQYFPAGLVRSSDVISDEGLHFKFDSNLISTARTGAVSELSGTGITYTKQNIGSSVIIPSGQTLVESVNTTADVTTGDFSVAGWVKWTSYPGVGTYIASKKNGTGSTTPGWILYTNPNGSLGGIITDTSNSRAILVGAGSQLVSNTWYHVAMVLNRDANIFRIYIDGIDQDTSISFDGSGGATSLAEMGSLTNTEVLTFGRAAAATIQYHDDWRFYNRALLQKDIDVLVAKSYIPKLSSLENIFVESVGKSVGGF